MNSHQYPTWIEINLSALEHNARIISEHVKVPVLAVIKDNAYGHGSVEAGKSFLAGGATWLAVVRCAEARALREAKVTAPILIFGGAVPEEIDEAIAQDLTLPLYDFESVELFSQRAKALGKTIKVHLKVDTGMGRFGVFPEEATQLAQKAIAAGGIEVDGVFSHLALAGDPGETLTPLQIQRFKSTLQSLHEAGIHPRWTHLANSSGITWEPGAYFNLVRAGGILYGLGRDRAGSPFENRLRRAFTWKASLMSCRQFPAGWGIGYDQSYTTREGDIIGVVPVGHGDGFRRFKGNQVLLAGQRVPAIGLVCMDQFMVLLPQMYPKHTEIVLVGKQGEQEITPEGLNKLWASSMSGVFLVNSRVPRLYYRD